MSKIIDLNEYREKKFNSKDRVFTKEESQRIFEHLCNYTDEDWEFIDELEDL